MEVILAVLLILFGLALGPIARLLEKREARKLREKWLRELAESHKGEMALLPGGGGNPPAPEPKGAMVLAVFAVLIVIFGLFTAVRYWSYLRGRENDLFFWAWLFLTMVFGMFVQVMAANHRDGRPLLGVQASQLLYPLLFSIVVFYPVWGIGASAPQNFFSFYAAFLNGFFWETTVAAAKPPAPPANQTP